MAKSPESSARLDRLRKVLAQSHESIRGKRLDAVVLSNITNIRYISGFTGSAALLLITPTEAFFLTDSRYTAQARGECPAFTVIETGYSGAMEPLGTLLTERPNLGRIGFEAANVTVSQFAQWKKTTPKGRTWIAIEEWVEKLRLIKDAGEIAKIRAAIVIAQNAFDQIRPKIAPGISERALALELEFAMRRLGADAVGFETIVASGLNGAFPHHHPKDKALAAGEMVTIDWGAMKDGYVSDITRTVTVPGAKPAEKLQEMFAVVKEAKQRAIAAIRPGVNGKVIDAIARDYIAEKGYGAYFGHSLGHSIGRVVHDGMILSFRAEKVILEPGMVTTVEPGIYVEGVGGVRLEEDVLVTANGHEVLTKAAP
jgi:Xaa-Pro aminopeptidase